MLKDSFRQICQNFSNKSELIYKLWLEIEREYSSPHRYYHTLEHLVKIEKERQNIKLNFEDSAIFQFATYYHDIVYDIGAEDNEEQSATLARERLMQLGVPNYIIDEVYRVIYLSKTHPKTDHIAHAYFLDADIAILGASSNEYQQYIREIRQEYQIYSDEIYYRGRQKVLRGFMEREELYQTDYFRRRYEIEAQKNILMEYRSIKI